MTNDNYTQSCLAARAPEAVNDERHEGEEWR